MEILFFIGIFVLLDIILVVFVLRKRKILSVEIQQQALVHWRKVERMTDAGKQVMEVEKLLDWLFKMKGYTGSFAQKLKKMNGKEAVNQNNLWFIHKLRNKVAHELDVEVSKQEQKKVLEYSRLVLQDLGLKISTHK